MCNKHVWYNYSELDIVDDHSTGCYTLHLLCLQSTSLVVIELWYYLMNIVIGVVALLVYMCVAKRYRYRERDEFCNIHQYAEEYHSNPRQEK